MKRTSSESRHSSNRKKRSRDGSKQRSDSVDSAIKDWTAEELDITKDVCLLEDLISEKTTLVDQLFDIFYGKELHDKIPNILKSYSTEELKKMCCRELECLPDDEILCILSGKSVRSSADENKPELDIRSTSISMCPDKQGKVANTLASNGESVEALDLHADQDEINSLMREGASRLKLATEKTRHAAPLEQAPQKPEENESCNSPSYLQQVVSNTFPNLEPLISFENGLKKDWLSVFTKTQMEILELELRAKAIRSLMQAQNAVLSDEEDSSQGVTGSCQN